MKRGSAALERTSTRRLPGNIAPVVIRAPGRKLIPIVCVSAISAGRTLENRHRARWMRQVGTKRAVVPAQRIGRRRRNGNRAAVEGVSAASFLATGRAQRQALGKPRLALAHQALKARVGRERPGVWKWDRCWHARRTIAIAIGRCLSNGHEND